VLVLQGKALYDYTPAGVDEVALQEGEGILVLEESDTGWWVCQNSKGEQGLAPAEYFQTLSESRVALVRRPSNKESKPPCEPEQLGEEIRSVISVDGVLGREECAELIYRAELGGFGANFDRGEIVAIREPKLADRLWQRLLPSISSHPQNKSEGWQAVGINEEFRLLRYTAHHVPVEHTDGGCNRPKEGKKSLLSVVIYLNEGFQGGATKFQNNSAAAGLTVEPEAGKAILFPHTLMHQSDQVAYGNKYVLRTDVIFQSLS